MSNHVVAITDAQGHVDNDVVTVNRDSGDQVTWTARPGEAATIVFASSPFGAASFSVPAGGKVSSGRATACNGKYKYTVKGSHGHNDPVVIIDGADGGG